MKALTRFDEPDLATLLTPGGEWTADDYLRLSGGTNRLVEFTGGCIEVLPMPTDQHQAMVETLFLLLRAYAARTHGKARFAPLRLRIGAARYREPDILFLRSARDPRRQDRFWTGADLVAEVVSPTIRSATAPPSAPSTPRRGSRSTRSSIRRRRRSRCCGSRTASTSSTAASAAARPPGPRCSTASRPTCRRSSTPSSVASVNVPAPRLRARTAEVRGRRA